MKRLKSTVCLCANCMEEHQVYTVSVPEQAEYKGKKIHYDAQYFYCDKADELYADEAQMKENDIRIKDAYRKESGLLTSQEIVSVRSKYKISQTDFCILLGWGGKTITRYESHQVQDKAHDSILKKIDQDPEWFLTLLEDSKELLKIEAYNRSLKAATELYQAYQDLYLRKAIKADYTSIANQQSSCGYKEIIERVIEKLSGMAESELKQYVEREPIGNGVRRMGTLN